MYTDILQEIFYIVTLCVSLTGFIIHLFLVIASSQTFFNWLRSCGRTYVCGTKLKSFALEENKQKRSYSIAFFPKILLFYIVMRKQLPYSEYWLIYRKNEIPYRIFKSNSLIPWFSTWNLRPIGYSICFIHILS